MCTFSTASATKCAMASEDKADQWEPLATTTHISSFVHGCLDLVGQLKVGNSESSPAAGWARAQLLGNMELQYVNNAS